MSTAIPIAEASAPIDPPELVRETAGVDRVLKLLAIYRKRLLGAVAEYRDIADARDRDIGHSGAIGPRGELLGKQFRPLRPAVAKLAQYASGLIENSRLSQLDKIELQLRLAELEAALDIATRTIR